MKRLAEPMLKPVFHIVDLLLMFVLVITIERLDPVPWMALWIGCVLLGQFLDRYYRKHFMR